MKRGSTARIRTLLFKEWQELKKARTMLATAFGVPLVMAAMAIGSVVSVAQVKGKPGDAQEAAKLLGERAALFSNAADAVAVYTGELGLMMMLLMPAIVPSLLAATSIVKEKQSRSLESLLVTPVRTWELVVAKMLFCLMLGVLPTYLSVGGFYLAARTSLSPLAFSMLTAPGWLIATTIGGPLLGVLAVGLAIAISARARDVQSAQQLAGLLCLPLIALMALQGSGFAALSTGSALLAVGVLLLLDLLMIAFSISLFERETVLTRWR